MGLSLTLTVILRHLLSIAILPFTVTVVVPVWLAHRFHVAFTLPKTAQEIGLVVAGAGS